MPRASAQPAAASPPPRAPLELWAGFECTLNRVGAAQYDQLQLLGNYGRAGDLDRLAHLGLRTIRYPILWERMHGAPFTGTRWRYVDSQMARMQALGITPIVGLVHHGSGPLDTSLLHDDFAPRLAAFARTVSERYPWVALYTPVNEPLTTARFSALYGLWYPHLRDDAAFLRATLNQILATRLAMTAIRSVNPNAQLVQTEDLGRVYSTRRLTAQADFENERRWLTHDLLTARVRPGHPMFAYARSAGITRDEIERAVGDGCPPSIIGLNHYVTSNRWLDERLDRYPTNTHGGNGRDRYADVEAVRVLADLSSTRDELLLETWSRYQLPLAITESHIGCTREQQLRWLSDGWKAACGARDAGADVRAVTTWAAFGTRDWTSLVTRMNGDYEPGLFDVRAHPPRRTALGGMARALAAGESFDHPALDSPGWWNTPARLSYTPVRRSSDDCNLPIEPTLGGGRPLLIAGACGLLGSAFRRVCAERGLLARTFSREQLDITDRCAVDDAINATSAWAVVNCAGYTRIDDAEFDAARCYSSNVHGPATLAALCAARAIRFITFSSDQVFDGTATRPYVESAVVSPLNAHGAAQAEAEARVLKLLPGALVIRTSTLFGPWDGDNLVTRSLLALDAGEFVEVADDVVACATFVPDLVNNALDLLIDGERGIWHLANTGSVTRAALVRTAAALAGVDTSRICARGGGARTAARPPFSALDSERGALMPSLRDALSRFAGAYRTFIQDQNLCMK